jgi:hypothetical protein
VPPALNYPEGRWPGRPLALDMFIKSGKPFQLSNPNELTMTATVQRSVNPVGRTTEEAVARRRRRSSVYREEAARLQPFEELARIVIGFRVERGMTHRSSPSAWVRVIPLFPGSRADSIQRASEHLSGSPPAWA